MSPARKSTIDVRLGKLLVERRKSANLTQIQLAERLERPQSFVAKVEAGDRRLSVEELLKVAAATGCSAEDILTELKSSHPSEKPRRGRAKPLG